MFIVLDLRLDASSYKNIALWLGHVEEVNDVRLPSFRRFNLIVSSYLAYRTIVDTLSLHGALTTISARLYSSGSSMYFIAGHIETTVPTL